VEARGEGVAAEEGVAEEGVGAGVCLAIIIITTITLAIVVTVGSGVRHWHCLIVFGEHQCARRRGRGRGGE
jgi:hypothetical protein